MSEGPKKGEAGAASQPPSGDEGTRLARRMLLKRGFLAPAVLASFVLAEDALGQGRPISPGPPPPKPCDPTKPNKPCAAGFDDLDDF